MDNFVSSVRKLRSSLDKKNKMDEEIFEDSLVADASQEMSSNDCVQQSSGSLIEMELEMTVDEVANSDVLRPKKRGLSADFDNEELEEGENPKYMKTANGERMAVAQSNIDLDMEIQDSLQNCDISQKNAEPVLDENTVRILGWVDQFMNLKGCNNDVVEKISAGQKWLIFDTQTQVVETYAAFMVQIKQKNPNYAEILSPFVKKINILLESWKSLLFDKSVMGEFVITKEMEDQNTKAGQIFSHTNTEFLTFLDKNLPLMEILYMMRLAGSLCLYNLTLALLFDEDFDDEF